MPIQQAEPTTVYVDAAANLNQAKDFILQTLQRTDNDLLWVTPGAEAQQVSV